ncbi:hypothetical protein [Duganella sp. Dugasp56]|uniref:hypothetical protein n=1 Tax=Duganella sp. Dugasp56 TaxID=3243046 RepID=UPI0039B0DEE6
MAKIADQINSLALHYRVGSLQKDRKRIGKLSRLPSKVLFDQRTVFEDWGWHYGGRKELQFNIGLEGNLIRYGVAFSLELSQSLQNIEILLPQIVLFNEYLSENSSRFSDLRMSYHFKNERDGECAPSSIPKEKVREGEFIFLGGTQNRNNIDYQLILETLDRLYSLYLYTRSDVIEENVFDVNYEEFSFRPGCKRKPSVTGGSVKEKSLDITLRHNDIQYELHKNLSLLYGSENVGTEIRVNGLSIDLVVRHDEGYWFYEIKTASSARACIRQGLGQILEYSYWPGYQRAAKLFIVGEPLLSPSELVYLNCLRSDLAIPLDYMTIDLGDK